MTTVRFEHWEKRQMRSPKFRAAAREQEPAYQMAQLRILRGLTKSQLARLVGTQQPSIARRVVRVAWETSRGNALD